MSQEWIYTIVFFAWLIGAACFVLGLHLMNSPATGRNGNRLSASGMAIAVGATLIDLIVRPEGLSTIALVIIVVGFLLGGGAGLYTARTVKMTAMPQLVSLFNAVGGGAAALVAIDDFVRLAGGGGADLSTTVFVVLGAVFGSVTFTGSLIAGGKLQGLIPGKPIVLPGGQILTIAVALVAVVGTVVLILGAAGTFALSSTVTLVVLALIVAAGLVFGITMVLPIGGADMPVVISLLNALTGTAAAMAGFVIGNPVLIIAGALVGASGTILTNLMATAMNRSVLNILAGGFGTGDSAAGTAVTGAGGSVREISADDAAIQLAYAQSVIIVPGYGLAVAQAQHQVRELAELLEAKGVDVKYAIHPVAGRMPGHMNVLLAEANVPYPQLKEMDEINPDFERCDVALVVGANDVTNPAARNPGSPVSGMPILDVDHAKSIIVIKRSMGRGYAGIDNELYV
ncbi:MAG: NAD(P)(+) transhydrogenase (Re/Si-specific) subunit beta, partial [Candidatus Limnocylindrales bacterium]